MKYHPIPVSFGESGRETRLIKKLYQQEKGNFEAAYKLIADRILGGVITVIAADGLKIIIITGLLLALSIVLTYLFPLIGFKILTVLVLIVFLFNFYFFRDPERSIPAGDDLILSPADGTVVLIEEVEEPYYFKEKVRRVSIFLIGV